MSDKTLVDLETLRPEIEKIAALLESQDNRATALPMFAVQQKRVVCGLDDGYADKYTWVMDGDEADDEEAVRLEERYAETYDTEIDGWRRVGIREDWEFVMGCFTEQGCKDHIAANGHNLKEPRIYAYGTHRNFEFHAVRKFLSHAPALFARIAELEAQVSGAYDKGRRDYLNSIDDGSLSMKGKRP